MARVHNVERDALKAGQARLPIQVHLVAADDGEAPAYVSTSEGTVTAKTYAEADANGRWVLDLYPNVAGVHPYVVAPVNSYYRIETVGPAKARVRHTVSVPNPPAPTTLTGAVTLPASTLDVGSTADYAAASVSAPRSLYVGGQIVWYTGMTATAFTGCSGGTGTIAGGTAVEQAYWVGDIPVEPPVGLPDLHSTRVTGAHGAAAIGADDIAGLPGANVQAKLASAQANISAEAARAGAAEAAISAGLDAETVARVSADAAETGLRLEGDARFELAPSSPDETVETGFTVPGGTFTLYLSAPLNPLTEITGLNTLLDPDNVAGADGAALASIVPDVGVAFNQATASLQPSIKRDTIDGHDSVYFDGTRWMRQDTGANAVQPQSVAVLAKLDSLALSTRHLVDGVVTSARMQVAHRNTGLMAAVTQNAVADLTWGPADLGWHLWVFRANGNDSRLARDEAEVSGPAGTGAAARLTLGASFGALQPWLGHVGWLAWTKAGYWSDALVQRIRHYAKERWPSLALPSSNLTAGYLPSGYLRLPGGVVLHYDGLTPTSFLNVTAFRGQGTVVAAGAIVEQVQHNRSRGALSADQVATRPIAVPPLIGTDVEEQIAELAAQYVAPTFGLPNYADRDALPEPAADGIVVQVTQDGLWRSINGDWERISHGFRPEWFGAVGDGDVARRDTNKAAFDTAMLRAAETGDAIVLTTPGKRYMVSADAGGVVINAPNLIFINAAEIKAAPNVDNTYDVVRFGVLADECWYIGVGGKIIGDLLEHVEGGGTDAGHGMRVQGSRNTHIIDLHASWTWGDGFYVGEDPATDTRPVGLWVVRPVLYEIRREGVGHFNCYDAWYYDVLMVDISKWAWEQGLVSGTTRTGFDVEPNNANGEEVIGLSIKGFRARNCMGRGLNIAGGVDAVVKAVTLVDLDVEDCGSTYPGTGHGINLAWIEDLQASVITSRNNFGNGIEARARVRGVIQGFTVDGNAENGVVTNPATDSGGDFDLLLAEGFASGNQKSGASISTNESVQLRDFVSAGNGLAGAGHPEVSLAGNGTIRYRGGAIRRAAGSSNYLLHLTFSTNGASVREVDLVGTGTAGKVLDEGAGNDLNRIEGFVTAWDGEVVIPAGSTTVTFPHRCAKTPKKQHIRLTPGNDLGAATTVWVSAITATDVTLTCDVDPGGAGAVVEVFIDITRPVMPTTWRALASFLNNVDLASYPTTTVRTVVGEVVVAAVESEGPGSAPNVPTITGWEQIGTHLNGIRRITFLRKLGDGTSSTPTIDFGGQVQRSCSVIYATGRGTKLTGSQGADAFTGPVGGNGSATSGSIAMSYSAPRNGVLAAFRIASAEAMSALGTDVQRLQNHSYLSPGSAFIVVWSWATAPTVGATWTTSGAWTGLAVQVVAA